MLGFACMKDLRRGGWRLAFDLVAQVSGVEPLLGRPLLLCFLPQQLTPPSRPFFLFH